MADYAERRRAFGAMHRPGQPFLLANAWDVASAVLLAEAGFGAIGTTSLGVAAGHGVPDGAGVARLQTLQLARRLTTLPVPITVDIESGFGQNPVDVAELVAELAKLGVVGINVEDGRHDGTLADVADQVRLLATVRSAVPEVFLNARTDTHWSRSPSSLSETLTRVAAYRDAGADGVFVPGLNSDADIAAVVRVGPPVNVLAGRRLPDLADLGVARVSCGSLLYRAALGTAVATARALAAGAVAPADVPSYERVAGLCL